MEQKKTIIPIERVWKYLNMLVKYSKGFCYMHRLIEHVFVFDCLFDGIFSVILCICVLVVLYSKPKCWYFYIFSKKIKCHQHFLVANKYCCSIYKPMWRRCIKIQQRVICFTYLLNIFRCCCSYPNNVSYIGMIDLHTFIESFWLKTLWNGKKVSNKFSVNFSPV